MPSAVTSVFGRNVIDVVWGALPIGLKEIFATVPFPFLAVPVREIPTAYEIVPFILSMFFKSVTGLSKKEAPAEGVAMSTSESTFGSYDISSCIAVVLLLPVSIITSTEADGVDVETVNELGTSIREVCARIGVGRAIVE